MTSRIKVLKKWEYNHGCAVECMCQADMTGEMVVGDLLGSVAYINADGSVRWSKKMDYTPHSIKLSEDGSVIYILTKNHYLIRLDREGKEAWGLWVMKSTNTLACTPKGHAAAVGGIAGTVQVITGGGERFKLLHTREPATYVRFAGRGGGLVAASALGWVGMYDKHWKLRREFHLRQNVTKLEVAASGRKVFLPALDGGLASVDVENEELLTYSPGFSVNSAAADQKGDRIIMTSNDGHIALVDAGGAELWKARQNHSWLFCDMTLRGDKFVTMSMKGFAACNAILTAKEAEKKLTDSYFEFLEI
ncbi:MAG: hypothetical protein OEV92_09360 [Nitrospinota bacterium]|nr:hypothetical protein [Nitrospinota bacterium]